MAQRARHHRAHVARRLVFVQSKTGYDIDRGPSCPERDRTDLRYGPGQPQVDEDAREAHEAFLDGAPLPGGGAG